MQSLSGNYPYSGPSVSSISPIDDITEEWIVQADQFFISPVASVLQSVQRFVGMIPLLPSFVTRALL